MPPSPCNQAGAGDRAAAAALILFANDPAAHVALITILLQQMDCLVLQSFIRSSYSANADAYPLPYILTLMNNVVRSPKSMVLLLQVLVAAGMTPASVDEAVLALVSSS